MNIIKEIGTPAMLEQLAEESVELAHACLKLSRKIRDENPTPREYDDIRDSVIEEISDVYLCIDFIIDKLHINPWTLVEMEAKKKQRWIERMKVKRDENEKSGNQKKPEER